MNPLVIASLFAALIATQLIDGKCDKSSTTIKHAQTQIHSDVEQELT